MPLYFRHVPDITRRDVHRQSLTRVVLAWPAVGARADAMQCSLKPLARFTAVALSAWFKSAKTRIQESSRTPPGRGGPQPQASWEVFIGGDLLSNHPQRTGDAEVV